MGKIDIESTLNDIKKGLDEEGEKQKKINTDRANEAIQKYEKETADAIDQTKEEYLEVINAADLQKRLDLRDIRETRANMGLSRSGLSATEQTAAILSAGNKTAKAQRQRQAAIDALNQSLLEYKNSKQNELTDRNQAIDTGIADTVAEARKELTKQANDLASQEYKAKLQYETSLNEAAAKAETTRRSELKSLLENGNIDQQVYGKALDQNWSVSDALDYYDKKMNGDGAYMDFVESQYPELSYASKAKANDTYIEYKDIIKRKRRQGYTERAALTACVLDLNKKVAQGEIDAETAAVIANMLCGDDMELYKELSGGKYKDEMSKEQPRVLVLPEEKKYGPNYG